MEFVKFVKMHKAGRADMARPRLSIKRQVVWPCKAVICALRAAREGGAFPLKTEKIPAFSPFIDIF